jgi:hypothetical protein
MGSVDLADIVSFEAEFNCPWPEGLEFPYSISHFTSGVLLVWRYIANDVKMRQVPHGWRVSKFFSIAGPASSIAGPARYSGHSIDDAFNAVRGALREMREARK